VVDLAGRRVFSRSVGSLGAGTHQVGGDASAPLRADIYFVRLVQRERALTARGVVVE
jgi:hypothetical protein